MRVQLITTMACEHGVALPGEIVDLPEDKARPIIDGKYGVAVDPPASVVESAEARVAGENRTHAPGETAELTPQQRAAETRRKNAEAREAARKAAADAGEIVREGDEGEDE